MAKGRATFQVEGYKEMQRDLRKAGKEAGKALGQAHKRVGQLIISKLAPAPDPRAVGTGKGANVRPSATKREVLILAGGKHRAQMAADAVARGYDLRSPLAAMSWGKKQSFSKDRPKRPYIIGTAREHEDEIIDRFSDETMAALKPYFYGT